MEERTKAPYGFEIIDAEDLYMKLYNPYYGEWKEKSE